MRSLLRILHLEDNPNDVALVQATLEEGGIACAAICAQTRGDFVAALERGGIDLILSDFSLPAFDGLSALEIVRDKWPSIPVIMVSGTLGEEQAIDSLKKGATDYVLKDRLCRLIPAVTRAIKEFEDRAAGLRAAETLRETEQRLAIIFSQSPLGIVLIGADNRPVLTNAALQKMLGYTGAELSRMRLHDFTHPEDCAPDLDFFRQLIRGDRQSYQIEKRYIRKDGSVFWGSLSVSVAREAAGHAGCAVGMVEDITERRHLEAQFIEAQKMEVLGHLAGGVAHDFNNILAIIMGYSDLAMENPGIDIKVRHDLEVIRSAGERAVGLTRQLLIFSRKQTVQPVVLDINEVVKDLAKMLRRLIDENIEMTIAAGNQLGFVKADSGYVGQVLMNLVVNARDAMPNGGKLAIATDNVTLDANHVQTHPGAIAGDYVMLSVSDTGIGMSEEVKAHLFEPFFTTKPKGKGTGLGLATCKTVVQQSGGHIGIYSEVGKGTTFKIYFPRVAQLLTIAPGAVKNGTSTRGTETLLVVEDDPGVRHLACAVLQGQGYEVLAASNGKDGLQVAREHKGSPVRMVVTDVVMPLMGGKVMAEWLKETYPDLKILFTSGYTDNTIAHDGVLEQGVEFLPKPYSPAALGRKVREMLDAPRLNAVSEPTINN